MKNRKNVLFSLIVVLSGVISCMLQAQEKSSRGTTTTLPPKSIVRTIKQDKKGNIWMASWEGVFKYDGKSFTNSTYKVSSARFFSVLEDKKGNFWFGTVGSGVYYFDGKVFKNYTVNDGLAGNSVTSIYEDKTGNIWFGTENGTSRYNGKSFLNLKMNEARSGIQNDSVYVGADSTRKVNDSVHVSSYQQQLARVHPMHNDVNAIVEDNKGHFWFGTRGYTTIYNGKAFTTITNSEGKPFTNVRSIIKDKKGNIWLGGADGLWRYDGKTFTNYTRNFVGYIYEDKKGNIWTSSENPDTGFWILSRYEARTLLDKNPIVREITNKKLIFGILEDAKGNVWFGSFDGVHRYDGNTITNFTGKTD